MSYLKRWWDWIDERQIDKHVASLVIMLGTIKVVEWAMAFAVSSKLPGVETAAVIAAVTTPYSALQAAALKYYFEARSTS